MMEPAGARISLFLLNKRVDVYLLQICQMEFPVGLGHMAGYLKGPQFPGHGPASLAGPFGLSHLDHSPYGGKFRKKKNCDS